MSTNQSPSEAPKLPHNRVSAIMAHTLRYAFKGRSRLANDCGVSKSAVSRLLNGHTRPTLAVALRVAEALERELGLSLSVREIFSESGSYPTTFICSLVQCPGCLPSAAVDENGSNPEYRDMEPGLWSGDIHELDSPLWHSIKEIE